MLPEEAPKLTLTNAELGCTGMATVTPLMVWLPIVP